MLPADKHVQRPTHHGTLPDELLHQGDGGGDADADADADGCQFFFFLPLHQ